MEGRMPRFLAAIHRPNDCDPAVAVTAEMRRHIDTLNDEMVAAGVRVFVGGLQPTRTAKSLRRQPDGAVVVTDGTYLQADEYVDGFWVLDVADIDAAMEWGKKAAVACQASVEVRPFH
jgi:hypothetical protein